MDVLLKDFYKEFLNATELLEEVGSTFTIGPGLPLLLIKAVCIYAEQIAISKLAQVVFLVKLDHKKRSFSFSLRSGKCITEGLIGAREIGNVTDAGISDDEIISQFVRLIVGLNLQERHFELVGSGRFNNFVSDALRSDFTVGNSLASEDKINGN